MALVRTFIRYIPTFLLAVALSLAVWISAVTSADPVEERAYPRAVAVELIGQDPGLVVTSELPKSVTLTLSTPRSVWDKLNNDQIQVRAILDLSGLKAGKHTLNVQVQVGARPVEIVSFTPGSFSLTLEPLTSRTIPIRLVRRGEPAVGYLAQEPTLSQGFVTVSGPQPAVLRAAQATAVLDINQVHETLSRLLSLQVVDENGELVSGITFIPDRVSVTQVITQRGGYRNVVVKVLPVGKVVNGYRLTNITVSPPAVTVFSTDPQLVNNLPGYVETSALNLNNVKDDFDIRLALTLPAGISVVGDQSVLVQVGVAAIEGSATFTNSKVEVTRLPEGLVGKASPETVDVILSGPLPLLDSLKPEQMRITVDLSGVVQTGKYQRTVKVVLQVNDLRVQSILPETVEVIVSIAPTATPTPRR